jgi:hypothetical protein
MCTVETVSRADVGLLAGLPWLPSPCTQDRFLQSVSGQSALAFHTALGQRLGALGPVTPGEPVNVEAHHMQTSSRTAMQQSSLTPEDRSGHAGRPCYRQDQASHKPLIALAASSGTTVSQGTRRLAPGSTMTRPSGATWPPSPRP